MMTSSLLSFSLHGSQEDSAGTGGVLLIPKPALRRTVSTTAMTEPLSIRGSRFGSFDKQWLSYDSLVPNEENKERQRLNLSDATGTAQVNCTPTVWL